MSAEEETFPDFEGSEVSLLLTWQLMFWFVLNSSGMSLKHKFTDKLYIQCKYLMSRVFQSIPTRIYHSKLFHSLILIKFKWIWICCEHVRFDFVIMISNWWWNIIGKTGQWVWQNFIDKNTTILQVNSRPFHFFHLWKVYNWIPIDFFLFSFTPFYNNCVI